MTQCMVRPCVPRGFRRSVGSSVLHQCIRPLIGACAPGHHGYQRACVLITGQASSGPFGSPVFACAGKTGPPSRFILSQTSAGNDCLTMSSLAPHRCSSFVRAMRPFEADDRNEFFPISMPIVATVAFVLLDMAVLLLMVPRPSMPRWRGRSTAGPFH